MTGWVARNEEGDVGSADNPAATRADRSAVRARRGCRLPARSLRRRRREWGRDRLGHCPDRDADQRDGNPSDSSARAGASGGRGSAAACCATACCATACCATSACPASASSTSAAATSASPTSASRSATIPAASPGASSSGAAASASSTTTTLLLLRRHLHPLLLRAASRPAALPGRGSFSELQSPQEPCSVSSSGDVGVPAPLPGPGGSTTSPGVASSPSTTCSHKAPS